ncbi:MAG: FHA domain-containing protein [Planctomycetaceae bacterium]|nr:FHA domain-containing protein [Planctomycetaceae bacterium]
MDELFLVGLSDHYLLNGDRLVGRSSRCDLVLKDPSVSRQHAKIVLEKKQVIICDLESRNGTFINDTPIAEAELPIEGVVRFGVFSFRLCRGPLQTDHIPDSIDSTHRLAAREDHLALRLSKAQTRVLRLLLDGLAEKTVAARLHLSPHTVHNHVREIYKVFNVTSRSALMSCFLPTRLRRVKLPE